MWIGRNCDKDEDRENLTIISVQKEVKTSKPRKIYRQSYHLEDNENYKDNDAMRRKKGKN